MTDEQLKDIEEKRRHDLDVQALVVEVRRLRTIIGKARHMLEPAAGRDAAEGARDILRQAAVLVCGFHAAKCDCCEAGPDQYGNDLPGPAPVPPPEPEMVRVVDPHRTVGYKVSLPIAALPPCGRCGHLATQHLGGIGEMKCNPEQGQCWCWGYALPDPVPSPSETSPNGNKDDASTK